MAEANDKSATDDPSGNGGHERPEEFNRFEALTRKLLKVTKDELDAKRNGSKPTSRSARRK